MMKKNSAKLTADVEKLLQQSVVADAATEVWGKWEKSLKALDKESLELIHEYLGGLSAKELSRQKKLTESEVNSWIGKIKREILHQLRQDSKLKQ